MDMDASPPPTRSLRFSLYGIGLSPVSVCVGCFMDGARMESLGIRGSLGKKGTEAEIIMHFVLPLETRIEVLDSWWQGMRN